MVTPLMQPGHATEVTVIRGNHPWATISKNHFRLHLFYRDDCTIW